jgi:hypothetical protein
MPRETRGGRRSRPNCQRASGIAAVPAWRHCARGRRIQLRRPAGTAEVDPVMLAARQDCGDALVDADVLRGIRQSGGRFLDRGQRGPRRSTHEIARARPRFEQAGRLKLAAGLERRGQAHVVQPHQRTHGRHPVTRRQRAHRNRLPIMARHLLVERGGGLRRCGGGRAGGEVGGHGGIFARWGEVEQIQMRCLCIVTGRKFDICSGCACDGLCLLARRAAR